jgi:hypothetical protein
MVFGAGPVTAVAMQHDTMRANTREVANMDRATKFENLFTPPFTVLAASINNGEYHECSRSQLCHWIPLREICSPHL